MKILNRFQAAFNAFKRPDIYWKGEGIDSLARDLSLGGRIGIVKYDPEIEYVIECVGYPQSRDVCEYLGLNL